MSEQTLTLTPLLPTVPSQLIRLALTDFVEVSTMGEKYEIDMSTWHTPRYNALAKKNKYKCAVCFAGAVIARTLGTDDAIYTHADYFPGNEKQLRALDEFRLGDIGLGLYRLGLIPRIGFGLGDTFRGMKVIDQVSLNDAWGGLPRRVRNISGVLRSGISPFVHDMNILADKLEGLGL